MSYTRSYIANNEYTTKYYNINKKINDLFL